MYISFRFNRRTKKLEGESHLREYEYSTTVGITTYCPMTTDLVIVNSLHLILPVCEMPL